MSIPISAVEGWKAGVETLPAEEIFVAQPQDVERRFVFLSRAVTEAQQEIETAENNYFTSKGAYEVAMAHSRIYYGQQQRDDGKPYTETQKEDYALRDNEQLFTSFLVAEAAVRVVRAKVKAVEQQVELTRSMGTSVRSAIAISNYGGN